MTRKTTTLVSDSAWDEPSPRAGNPASEAGVCDRASETTSDRDGKVSSAKTASEIPLEPRAKTG